MGRLVQGLESSLRGGHDIGYAHGAVGIACVLAHVAGRFGHDDTLADLEVVDDQLLRLVQSSKRWVGRHDLESGLVGLGVYGLERRHRGGGDEILSLVLERLLETAHYREGRALWNRRTEDGAEIVDVSIPGGVAGVVWLLAKMAMTGVMPDRSKELLEAAVNGLESLRLPSPATGGFPGKLSPAGSYEPTAPCWCYGDLGIALVLVQASLALSREDWFLSGTEIALRHASTRPLWMGRDAGFCHGSAGNAHLYARLYAATGDSTFAAAALASYQRTLQLHGGQNHEGYRFYWDSRPHWRWVPGLLRGSVGVSLVLNAAISNEDPAWDSLLLAS